MSRLLGDSTRADALALSRSRTRLPKEYFEDANVCKRTVARALDHGRVTDAQLKDIVLRLVQLPQRLLANKKKIAEGEKAEAQRLADMADRLLKLSADETPATQTPHSPPKAATSAATGGGLGGILGGFLSGLTGGGSSPPRLDQASPSLSGGVTAPPFPELAEEEEEERAGEEEEVTPESHVTRPRRRGGKAKVSFSDTATERDDDAEAVGWSVDTRTPPPPTYTKREVSPAESEAAAGEGAASSTRVTPHLTSHRTAGTSAVSRAASSVSPRPRRSTTAPWVYGTESEPYSLCDPHPSLFAVPGPRPPNGAFPNHSVWMAVRPESHEALTYAARQRRPQPANAASSSVTSPDATTTAFYLLWREPPQLVPADPTDLSQESNPSILATTLRTLAPEALAQVGRQRRPPQQAAKTTPAEDTTTFFLLWQEEPQQVPADPPEPPQEPPPPPLLPPTTTRRQRRTRTTTTTVVVAESDVTDLETDEVTQASVEAVATTTDQPDAGSWDSVWIAIQAFRESSSADATADAR